MFPANIQNCFWIFVWVHIFPWHWTDICLTATEKKAFYPPSIRIPGTILGFSFVHFNYAKDLRVQNHRYTKIELLLSFKPSTTSREVSIKLSMTFFHWFVSFQDILCMCVSLMHLNHTLKTLPTLATALLPGKYSRVLKSTLGCIACIIPWKRHGLKLFQRSEGLPLLCWSNLMSFRCSEKDNENLYALGIRTLSPPRTSTRLLPPLLCSSFHFPLSLLCWVII